MYNTLELLLFYTAPYENMRKFQVLVGCNRIHVIWENRKRAFTRNKL